MADAVGWIGWACVGVVGFALSRTSSPPVSYFQLGRGSRYPTLACTAFPAKESRTSRCGLRRSAQGDWQRGDHRRFRAGR